MTVTTKNPTQTSGDMFNTAMGVYGELMEITGKIMLGAVGFCVIFTPLIALFH